MGARDGHPRNSQARRGGTAALERHHGLTVGDLRSLLRARTNADPPEATSATAEHVTEAPGFLPAVKPSPTTRRGRRR